MAYVETDFVVVHGTVGGRAVLSLGLIGLVLLLLLMVDEIIKVGRLVEIIHLFGRR